MLSSFVLGLGSGICLGIVGWLMYRHYLTVAARHEAPVELAPEELYFIVCERNFNRLRRGCEACNREA